MSQHSNRSQLSEAFVVEVELISDRRCRSIGDRSKSRAGGGCLEAKAVGRQASRGGSRPCGSGGGISSTMVSRGSATGRIDRKKLCGCRYVAFQRHLSLSFAICLSEVMCYWFGRTRHAEPGGSITCHKWKNALATVGTRQRKDRRKRCLLYHPQLDRNNGRKSTGIFSGDHMSLHSQLRYDNLHLADLRYGRNFLAAVTLGSLTVRCRTGGG